MRYRVTGFRGVISRCGLFIVTLMHELDRWWRKCRRRAQLPDLIPLPLPDDGNPRHPIININTTMKNPLRPPLYRLTLSLFYPREKRHVRRIGSHPSSLLPREQRMMTANGFHAATV